MKLNANVKIDRFFLNKITSNDLNSVDCFKIAMAESLCKLFPKEPVYLIPQQQTKPIMQIPPAVFVQISPDIHREKRFNGECEWEFSVNIAYMSKEANAETEQTDAAIKIMDMIESIPPVEGMKYPYTIYDSTSNTVDGIVNVTGIVNVWERRKDNSPLIEVADANVFIKEVHNGCN